jgi:hypothetical protein
MESIGFTMMYVFFYFFIFVSVITFWGSKNASIFLNSNFNERKMNVDGTWASQKSKASKKTVKKKLRKNGNFYAKPRFGKLHFFKNALTQKSKPFIQG